jgi:hypothetical protein
MSFMQDQRICRRPQAGHTAAQPRQAERSELESARLCAREALRASEVWHATIGGKSTNELSGSPGRGAQVRTMARMRMIRRPEPIHNTRALEKIVVSIRDHIAEAK